MITLAVGAILLSLAVPSFQDITMNNRLTTQANELISALNYARSEAIRSGTNINTSRADTNWHNGWTIANNGGQTLRSYSAFSGTSTLVGSSTTVTYQSTGLTTAAAAISFTLCDDRTGETGRTISISPTGRLSISNLNCT